MLNFFGRENLPFPLFGENQGASVDWGSNATRDNQASSIDI